MYTKTKSPKVATVGIVFATVAEMSANRANRLKSRSSRKSRKALRKIRKTRTMRKRPQVDIRLHTLHTGMTSQSRADDVMAIIIQQMIRSQRMNECIRHSHSGADQYILSCR